MKHVLEATNAERLARPEACDDRGFWWESGWKRPAWTPLGFIRRGQTVTLTCDEGHSRQAPLAELVASGRGDDPLHLFKWRCAECGSNAIKVGVSPLMVDVVGKVI